MAQTQKVRRRQGPLMERHPWHQRVEAVLQCPTCARTLWEHIERVRRRWK